MQPTVNLENTAFFVGLPDEANKAKIDKQHEKGGKIIWILRPDDARKFSCPYGDLACEWRNDIDLQSFLFEHIAKNNGGEIMGSSEAAVVQFTGLFANIAELHSFDARSNEILSKKSQPMKNALRNYKWVEEGVPLRRLQDMGKTNKTFAVIVAAGPSLDPQWSHLKRTHTKEACVITVGRSYNMLMQHGVCPEFIVEAEQYEWNSRMWYFAPKPPSHTLLCTPLSVDPGILRGWPGAKCILLDHPTGNLMGMDAKVDTIDGGNSVAHIALNLALRLGCNPIYFAGVDLAYPDGPAGETHAKGTFHAWPADILSSEHTHQGNLPVMSNDGTPVQSSQPYVNFRTYFELMIHKAKHDRPDLRFYTFSKRGQKMAGVDYLEIETWNGQPPSESPSSSDSSSSSPSPPVASVGVSFPSGAPKSSSETPVKP